MSQKRALAQEIQLGSPDRFLVRGWGLGTRLASTMLQNRRPTPLPNDYYLNNVTIQYSQTFILLFRQQIQPSQNDLKHLSVTKSVTVRDSRP